MLKRRQQPLRADMPSQPYTTARSWALSLITQSVHLNIHERLASSRKCLDIVDRMYRILRQFQVTSACSAQCLIRCGEPCSCLAHAELGAPRQGGDIDDWSRKMRLQGSINDNTEKAGTVTNTEHPVANPNACHVHHTIGDHRRSYCVFSTHHYHTFHAIHFSSQIAFGPLP